jgi:hypothetical protein
MVSVVGSFMAFILTALKVFFDEWYQMRNRAEQKHIYIVSVATRSRRKAGEKSWGV